MKIFILLIFLLIPLFSCSSKKEKVLFLGNIISSTFVEKMKNEEKQSDFSFLKNKETISSIYKDIEVNAKSINSNKKIVSLMKNARCIVINSGIYDILKSVKIINSSISIMEENEEKSLELFEYYLFNILEEVDENATVKYLSIFNPYKGNINNIEKLDFWIEKYNQVIKGFKKIAYIDISPIEEKLSSSFVISDEGEDFLIDMIING